MPKLILFDNDGKIVVTKQNDFLDLESNDIFSMLLDVDTELHYYLNQISLEVKENLNVHYQNVTKIIFSNNIDEPEYYTAMLSVNMKEFNNNTILKEFNVCTVRELMLSSDENRISLISKARQLSIWNNDHKYCGRCANITKRILHEYARECTVCGHTVYPRISPCVLVAIINQDKILLGRSPHFPPGVYSLIAGFIEVGETCEQAVVREVFEETGVTVNNIKYFGSQQWPFPHSMMLAYTADYVSGNLVIAKDELEDARWFSFKSLRTCPDLLPLKAGLSRMLLDDLIAKYAS